MLTNILAVTWLFLVIAILFLWGGFRLHAQSEGIDGVLYARELAERVARGDA